MKIKTPVYYIITIITGLSFSLLAQQKPSYSTREIINKMTKSIKEVQGLKYNLKIIERGKKGYNHYESAVKLFRKPRMLYINIKGIEILWCDGKNKGKALIRPNAFPYFNLNLDPMGNLMRQDQHHTINEMGFDYFGNLMEHMATKFNDKFESYFKTEGEERYNNRPCYKIVINNPEFGYTNYTVAGEHESLHSIARKLYVSEYMIVELNHKLKDYFDILKKGQVIKVPNWYAKQVVIFIDQLYFLPIGVKVSDDKSLFEEYNYHYVQVNPAFETGEFTKDFKGYKF